MPTLKRAVTVSGDIVRIGDLLENAGASADAAIFRSPDIGTTGAVSVQKVLDALQPHPHLSDQHRAACPRSRSPAPDAQIDFSDLEARIAQAFAGRYGLGEAKNLAVTLDVAPRPAMVEASVTGDLTLTSAALNPMSGRFEIAFEVPGSAILRKPLRFTGSIVETVEVAVTTRALARRRDRQGRRPRGRAPAQGQGRLRRARLRARRDRLRGPLRHARRRSRCAAPT